VSGRPVSTTGEPAHDAPQPAGRDPHRSPGLDHHRGDRAPLGLAGLQARATLGELEALQRAQALVLLQNMVDRINSNRKAPWNTPPPTSGARPGGADCAPVAPRFRAADMCEWSNALTGAAEVSGGANTGAMIGARGCIVEHGPDDAAAIRGVRGVAGNHSHGRAQ
jgi:type IV pilus assembly protein PilV